MTDFSGVEWRKSQRSGDNGACVEIARAAAAVGIRDSKDRSGPVLSFAPAAFADFLAATASGEFDLPR
jgi:hypothetical protein